MKFSTIFSGITLVAATGACLFTTSLLNREVSTSYEPRQQNFIRHAQDWNRAAEYYQSIRANVITGKVELADVVRAREAVRKFSAKKTGSLNLQWTERGPNNVGGRTRAILIDKNNSAHVLAGSVSGGLFVSNNSGSTWDPVPLANQDNLIVSSLTQAPDGSIWMGTGSDFDYSANMEGILFPGNGLFRSGNGGASFTRIVGPTVPNNSFDTMVDPISNTKEWASINRIAFKPGNSNEIYVAMNKGLRVSNDGGQTWVNPIYAVHTTCTGPIQVVRGEDLDVTTDGRLFVSIDGQIYYSDNPMVCSTYVKVTAVPRGKRTEIAVSPTDPNYVYALTVDLNGHFSGVYQSTNKGVSWTKILFKIANYFEPMTNSGLNYGQGVYDLAFSVAPDNPGKIFIGGVQLWMYNGNLTRIAEEFSNYPPYYVHADKHVFSFDPNNANIMYVGTDGGIFKSFDQGGSFFSANTGYNVTQFYAMGFSNPAPGKSTALIGGTQDNGTILMQGESGSNYLSGDDVIGGDGFDCDFSSITGAVFGSLYNACVFRSSSIGNSFATISGSFCGDQAIFHTVTRLWESNTDITSKDSILFRVDSTKQGIGTGNGTQKTFSGSLTPLQAAADVVIGSLRIQVGTSGTTFNDAGNSTNNYSTFSSGTNTCTVNYSAKTFTVTFTNAPSVNTPVWVYFTTAFSAGEVLTLASNTADVPVKYMLTTNLNFGDSIRVQDPVQSILALGTGAQGGVSITRYGLRFNETVDDKWIKLNTTGTPSCIEFSKDGNHMFIGIDQVGVYRISGLNNVYTQTDVTGTPSKITKTKIYAPANNSYAITGIAVDYDNPQNVLVTIGNYGHYGFVFRSTNAVSATNTVTAAFVDVSQKLPPMPVYDAEFIKHSSKVVIGTEFGIYSTSDIFASSVEWADENNGTFPHMPVFEVRQQKFFPSNNHEMLFIGTHGRGVWESGSLVTAIKEPSESIQSKFISEISVFPNPMKDDGYVAFNLQAAGTGTILIFDLKGRNVKSLLKQSFNSGINKVKIDTENLPAGAYFISVEAGEASSVGKFVVVR